MRTVRALLGKELARQLDDPLSVVGITAIVGSVFNDTRRISCNCTSA
jgi:hypothetical protein